jgi:hypothetical protein
MHVTNHDEAGSQGFPHRRAWRGDGSPLASFLCPVCHADVLAEGVACRHLLLVLDRHGEIYCKTPAIHGLLEAAERKAGARGLPAMERLRDRLGGSVLLYELLGLVDGTRRTESVWFLVDQSERVRWAA